MKHWALNFYNQIHGDKRVHMSIAEIKKYNKEGQALPEHIIVHTRGDRASQAGKKKTTANLSNIYAPNSVLEINGFCAKGNYFVAEKVIINDIGTEKKGKRTNDLFASFTKSRIGKIDTSNRVDLQLKDIDLLSEINYTQTRPGDFNPRLKIKNAPDLIKINNNSSESRISNMGIKNTPKLQSSETVEILNAEFKDNVTTFLKQSDIYSSPDIYTVPVSFRNGGQFNAEGWMKNLEMRVLNNNGRIKFMERDIDKKLADIFTVSAYDIIGHEIQKRDVNAHSAQLEQTKIVLAKTFGIGS